MVLFSLVLALGMLVDNGIVVVENVYRLMDDGLNAFEATKHDRLQMIWLSKPQKHYRLECFVASERDFACVGVAPGGPWDAPGGSWGAPGGS